MTVCHNMESKYYVQCHPGVNGDIWIQKKGYENNPETHSNINAYCLIFIL